MRTLQTITLSLILTACAGAQSAGPTANPGADAYVIGVEDVVSINVWHEQEISRVLPVRPDGKVALPLAGEFQAAGKTPKQLESDIAQKLQNLIQNPQVTVIVQDVKSQKFSIMGEVNRPGAYPLAGRMNVLEAIALAGGLKDFAKTKKMYILRREADGSSSRVKVNYKDLLAGKVDESKMVLRARDTVVVP